LRIRVLMDFLNAEMCAIIFRCYLITMRSLPKTIKVPEKGGVD
jgi:hypothetical protein